MYNSNVYDRSRGYDPQAYATAGGRNTSLIRQPLNAVDQARQQSQNAINRMSSYGEGLLSGKNMAENISTAQRLSQPRTDFLRQGAMFASGMGYSPGAMAQYEQTMQDRSRQDAYDFGTKLTMQDKSLGAGLLGQATSAQLGYGEQIQNNWQFTEKQKQDWRMMQEQLGAQKSGFGGVMGDIFGIGFGALTGGIGTAVGGLLGNAISGGGGGGGTGMFMGSPWTPLSSQSTRSGFQNNPSNSWMYDQAPWMKR